MVVNHNLQSFGKICYVHKDVKRTYLLHVRQLMFISRTFGCCQNLLWNVKSLKTFTDSIVRFTVTMLAGVFFWIQP